PRARRAARWSPRRRRRPCPQRSPGRRRIRDLAPRALRSRGRPQPPGKVGRVPEGGGGRPPPRGGAPPESSAPDLMSKRTVGALSLAAVLAVVLSVVLLRARSLPPNLSGALVFVSDRDGPEALYWRRLPRDGPRRLTDTSEPVRDPALAPDGERVAFAMGGRIGVVSVARGDLSLLTLGVDWRDAMPAWLPNGKGLVVSARRSSGETASLQLLDLQEDGPV